MSEHMSPIPSMIYNASVGGHVTNSQQIIDENLNREQQDINEEVAAVPYNATTPNGMGKIVLKKNDNFKQVVEAQTDGNTIFVIKYDFILTGNVTIPANCVLEFDGGSLSNGSVDFNNCIINSDKNTWIFKNFVDFEGLKRISIKWFGAKGDYVTDDTDVFKLVLNTIHEGLETVKIPEGVYILTDSINHDAATNNSLKNINIVGLGNNPTDSRNDTYKNYTELRGTASLVFIGDIQNPCIEGVKSLNNINIRGEAISYAPEYGTKELRPKYADTIAINNVGASRLNNVKIRYFGTGIKQDYTYNSYFNTVKVEQCLVGIDVYPQQSYITLLNMTNIAIHECWRYGLWFHSDSYFIYSYIDGIDVSTCGREDYDVYGNIKIDLKSFNIAINNCYMETIDIAPNSPLLNKQNHIGFSVKGELVTNSIFKLNKAYISGYSAGVPAVNDKYTRYLFISGCNAVLSEINAPNNSVFIDNAHTILNGRLMNYEKATLYVENSTFYQITGNDITLNCVTTKNVSIINTNTVWKNNSEYFFNKDTNNKKYMAFLFDSSVGIESLFHDLKICVSPDDINTLIETSKKPILAQVLHIFANSYTGNAITQPVVISTGYNYYNNEHNLVEKVYLSYEAGTNNKVIILQKRDTKSIQAVYLKSSLAVKSYKFTNDIAELSDYDMSIYTEVDYNINNIVNVGVNKVVDTTPVFDSKTKTINKGVCLFNTTLNKPIWWNGTNWIDATGATV